MTAGISTSVSTWALGLGGGFDAPHAVYVSGSNTEGNGVGTLVQPPVAGFSLAKPVTESDVITAAAEGQVRLSFEFKLAEQTRVIWETVVLGGALYLSVDGTLPEGSKEAFVSLLEYAEEVLDCSVVIVFFRNDRSDRAMLIRTFMFLGFCTVPPGRRTFLGGSNEHFYMKYEIE